MESKFTLYDFLAIIIPGSIPIIAIAFLISALSIEFPLQNISGLIETTLFLFLSYYLGLLVQAVGKWYERTFLITSWDGFPSVRFIRMTDTFYSPDFKQVLREAIETRFKIKLPNEGEDKKLADKKLQEAFNLCYTFVTEKGHAQAAYLMNVTYGLFRGLVVASELNAILFLFICGCLFFDKDWGAGIFYAAFFIFFWWASYMFKNRTKQRAELFADHIYRSFYSFHTEKA